jgi:formate-dependent nitrite reductase membrane component NrfD
VNLFVADPHWGVWVVAYFFLGGIAAGAYLLATLLEWFGNEDDAKVARVAHWVAVPLTVLCAVILVIDLGRPERFWHMVLKSEVTRQAFAEGFPFSAAGWRLASHAVMFKPWSPMSAGSHGLGLFGLCAFVSFLVAVRPHWRVGRWLNRRWVMHPVRAVGLLAAFYTGSYTGSLLSATNQPVWSDTTWLSALFLASSVSTGLAAMILLARWKDAGTPEARHKLESADLWAVGLEFAVFVAFLASLGAVLEPVLSAVTGNLLVFGTLLLGLAAPLVIHKVYGTRGWSQAATAACVLAGGLCLRTGVVTVNAELLARGPAANRGISPELTRRVGQPGADPQNHGPETIVPRTKLAGEP